jgi:hypothetical protein
MKDSERSFPRLLKQMLGGGGYVSFPELLMGVTRGGCFREFPSLQYMMQALPPSGCLRPLMMATSLADVGGIAEEFTRMTGFRRVYVSYLMDSFAFALGMLGVEPAIPPMDDEPTAMASDIVAEAEGEYGDAASKADARADEEQQPDVPQWNNHWSSDEKTRFLASLIQINRDNERRLGVKAINPACCFVGESNFKLSVELRRDEPGATGGLYYAIYARDGVVLETSLLGAICYDDVTPLPRVATAQVVPAKVGKILLFWD